MPMSKAEIERRGKRLYPEGLSLSIDRSKDAELVFSPDKIKDWEKWREMKNKSDMKGYDDTSAQERPVRLVKRDISGGYVASEPDRFLRSKQKSRKMLEEQKELMHDYDSFKEAVEKAWHADRKGLSNLLDAMHEADFKALYEQPLIQDWIENNQRPMLIQYIMKRYKLEPVRASRVVIGLSSKVRNRLYLLAVKRKLPKVQVLRRVPRRAANKPRIKWSVEEKNLLRVNRKLRPELLTELLNRLNPYNRTVGSVKSQMKKI